MAHNMQFHVLSVFLRFCCVKRPDCEIYLFNGMIKKFLSRLSRVFIYIYIYIYIEVYTMESVYSFRDHTCCEIRN